MLFDGETKILLIGSENLNVNVSSVFLDRQVLVKIFQICFTITL